MSPLRIAIVTPVFNDWDSFQTLINDINNFAYKFKIFFKVIAVDDSSTLINYPKNLSNLKNIEVEIIRLRNNLGHQRAIAVGLCEAYNS